MEEEQHVVNASPAKNFHVDKPAPLYQFRAMFLKNISLQKRQKCTICCQCAVPILIMILVGVLTIVIDNLVKNSQGNVAQIVYNSFPTGGFTLQFTESPALEYGFFVNAPPPNLEIGTLSINGNSSGLLGNATIQQSHLNVLSFPPGSYVPFFEEQPDSQTIDNLIINVLNYLENNKNTPKRFQTQSSTTFNESVPAAVILMNGLTQNPLSIDYTVMTGTNGFSSQFRIDSQGWVTELMSNGFLRYFMNPNVYIRTYIQSMPVLLLNLDPTSLLASILFPFAYSFLLPVYVYDIVYEKQERLREMMKMMGLNMSMYWLITFLYDFFLYLLQFIITLVICLAFRVRFFSYTNFGIILLLFLGWGLAQIGMAFFLSVLFSSTRTAIIFSYILVIIVVIFALISSLFTYSQTLPYKIYPPLAFYRGITIISQECGNFVCPQTIGTEMTQIVLDLWLAAPILIVLALYLDQVLPKQYGVRKSPFFFLKTPWRLIKRRIFKKEESKMDEVIENLIKNEDEDVAKERKRITEGEISSADYTIVIYNLSKTYKSFGQHRKVALVDLALSIPKDECFGLLGPNGAGKTTTISILTGLFPPTSGTAKIGGFDIRTDMEQIHRIIGVCPQFDTLWDSLTAEETLLFYTRLKGVFGKQAKEFVDESLRQVSLEDAKGKLVSQLSGGMKRRLSVAVSLVGDPAVIFLDEPTTGLDPASRRSLWDVLLQIKKGRAIVLTTHSMEEADVLCTRIGIMSRGCLQCLGSNVRLKNKFGEGYTLKINFNPKDVDQVTSFISSVLPNSKLTESFPGNYTYQIPSEGFSLSSLFNTLVKQKDSVGILDWGVSQTSLEDVFLNIVKRDEVHEEKKK